MYRPIRSFDSLKVSAVFLVMVIFRQVVDPLAHVLCILRDSYIINRASTVIITSQDVKRRHLVVIFFRNRTGVTAYVFGSESAHLFDHTSNNQIQIQIQNCLFDIVCQVIVQHTLCIINVRRLPLRQ